MKIRRSAVNDWEVEVRFQGVSVEQDGPFLFWEVVADHPSHCPLFRWCGTREEAMTDWSHIWRRANE
jgi:hypothetical protein